MKTNREFLEVAKIPFCATLLPRMAGYKTTLVTYLDILGFRDLIRASESNPQQINVLASILHITRRRAKFRAHLRNGEPAPFPKIKRFSDLIIRATPIQDGNVWDALFFELLALAAMQTEITCKYGILLRGGISLGDLFLDVDMIFGPALVRAYQLAEKLAVHPRIVLDPDLLSHLGSLAPGHTAFSLVNLERQDGLYFVDYLRGSNFQYPFELDINRDPITYVLQLHRAMVVKKLDEFSSKDERVKQKGAWLAAYHNSTILQLIDDHRAPVDPYALLVEPC